MNKTNKNKKKQNTNSSFRHFEVWTTIFGLVPSQIHSFACSSPVLRSSTSFSYLDWGDWYTGHDAWTHCSRFGLPKCGGTNECHRLRNLNWLKRDIHYVKNEILFWLRVRATKSRRQEKWWRGEKRNQTCICVVCTMYPFLDLGFGNVWMSRGGFILI